jgi:hypothetical protein
MIFNLPLHCLKTYRKEEENWTQKKDEKTLKKRGQKK